MISDNCVELDSSNKKSNQLNINNLLDEPHSLAIANKKLCFGQMWFVYQVIDIRLTWYFTGLFFLSSSTSYFPHIKMSRKDTWLNSHIIKEQMEIVLHLGECLLIGRMKIIKVKHSSLQFGYSYLHFEFQSYSFGFFKNEEPLWVSKVWRIIQQIKNVLHFIFSL